MAKGAAAEAFRLRDGAEEDAGLRENMSQTVTKVESCHWSVAGMPPGGYFYRIQRDREFFIFERLTFFILIKVAFRGSDAQSEDNAEKIAG